MRTRALRHARAYVCAPVHAHGFCGTRKKKKAVSRARKRTRAAHRVQRKRAQFPCTTNLFFFSLSQPSPSSFITL